MPHLNIDRLEVHVKGIDKHRARAATDELGAHLLQRLAQQESIAQAQGRVELNELDLGTVREAAGSSAAALRHDIAERTAEALAACMPPADPPTGT